ncbi:response regulator transcription factor [Aestuariibacter sp. AA17]|uniref:Response regulator transcription factor n=1 Tax=Fluctibacter corallii TaxID=2984329 RepID=A0ABT3A3B2_9ALTE|nr:response regulator transcription factor [Aestuariibacter sp. AA17]MCV2883166.1 response regulator transcription factor [Aestuariibacter sp. AA17]
MCIKVMLVDDQNLVREGIKSLLALKHDIRVVAEEADGEDVLSRIYACRPDIVLLDIRMPKVSGVDVLRQLNQVKLPVPILVLTTFDEHELVLECIRLGAKGYLRKDISFSELSQAIYALHEGKTWYQPAVSSQMLPDNVLGFTEDKTTFGQLTDIEIEVLRLVAAGFSNNEIANALHKSHGTIRNQMSSILTKLNVRDRTRAVLKAMELSIL